MKRPVKSIIRSVEGLSSNEVFEGLKNVDRLTIQGASVIDAYQTNPYLDSLEQPAEMIGVVDDTIIGSVGVMPMRMIADGKSYRTVANPDTRVDAEYRKTGYALDLIDFGFDNAADGIRVDFYVSESARKVMKMFGGTVFNIAQFALVKRSSLFFKDRLPKYVSWLGCAALDVAFFFHRLVIKVILLIKTSSWKMSITDDEESLREFADLIATDSHRFRNDVSETFLKWIIAHDFRGIDIADKHLWRFICKNKTIGFVLMRKDGTGRGRLIDWQATSGNEALLPIMMLKAADTLLSKCKAVVISASASDQNIVAYFSHKCPKLPTQAAVIAVSDSSPLQKHEGWQDQSNWRIRPTMGDSCLF